MTRSTHKLAVVAIAAGLAAVLTGTAVQAKPGHDLWQAGAATGYAAQTTTGTQLAMKGHTHKMSRDDAKCYPCGG